MTTTMTLTHDYVVTTTMTPLADEPAREAPAREPHEVVVAKAKKNAALASKTTVRVRKAALEAAKGLGDTPASEARKELRKLLRAGIGRCAPLDAPLARAVAAEAVREARA